MAFVKNLCESLWLSGITLESGSNKLKNECLELSTGLPQRNAKERNTKHTKEVHNYYE